MVASLRELTLDGIPFDCVASFGVRPFSGDRHQLHDLLREADTAIYASKSRKGMGLLGRALQVAGSLAAQRQPSPLPPRGVTADADNGT